MEAQGKTREKFGFVSIFNQKANKEISQNRYGHQSVHFVEEDNFLSSSSAESEGLKLLKRQSQAHYCGKKFNPEEGKALIERKESVTKFQSPEVACLNESEQKISIRLVGMKDKNDQKSQRDQNYSLLRDCEYSQQDKSRRQRSFRNFNNLTVETSKRRNQMSFDRIEEPQKQSGEVGESGCSDGDLELFTRVAVVQNVKDQSQCLNQDEQFDKKSQETPRFSQVKNRNHQVLNKNLQYDQEQAYYEQTFKAISAIKYNIQSPPPQVVQHKPKRGEASEAIIDHFRRQPYPKFHHYEEEKKIFDQNAAFINDSTEISFDNIIPVQEERGGEGDQQQNPFVIRQKSIKNQSLISAMVGSPIRMRIGRKFEENDFQQDVIIDLDSPIHQINCQQQYEDQIVPKAGELLFQRPRLLNQEGNELEDIAIAEDTPQQPPLQNPQNLIEVNDNADHQNDGVTSNDSSLTDFGYDCDESPPKIPYRLISGDGAEQVESGQNRNLFQIAGYNKKGQNLIFEI